PFTPTSPNNHPIYIFVIAGIFGGVLLGCGLAIMLELSDTTLRRVDHLESLAGVPVLSRIPQILVP
ncbi:MAG: chain-length determining protein, partial [Gammaproteobacteria bacterium]